MCVAIQRFVSMIAHVLGKSEYEELCDLDVRSLWDFLEVIRQFVASFLIGEPLFAYVKFMALSLMSLLCCVFMKVCRFPY